MRAHESRARRRRVPSGLLVTTVVVLLRLERTRATGPGGRRPAPPDARPIVRGASVVELRGLLLRTLDPEHADGWVPLGELGSVAVFAPTVEAIARGEAGRWASCPARCAIDRGKELGV